MQVGDTKRGGSGHSQVHNRTGSTDDLMVGPDAILASYNVTAAQWPAQLCHSIALVYLFAQEDTSLSDMSRAQSGTSDHLVISSPLPDECMFDCASGIATATTVNHGFAKQTPCV